ncbi:hypothetical protein C8R43DRAFT_1115552 [Mycena crocata]|nr:hypothetical protein C8R43DRAFT_1115552 [Mycena crocata]
MRVESAYETPTWVNMAGESGISIDQHCVLDDSRSSKCKLKILDEVGSTGESASVQGINIFSSCIIILEDVAISLTRPTRRHRRPSRLDLHILAGLVDPDECCAANVWYHDFESRGVVLEQLGSCSSVQNVYWKFESLEPTVGRTILEERILKDVGRRDNILVENMQGDWPLPSGSQNGSPRAEETHCEELGSGILPIVEEQLVASLHDTRGNHGGKRQSRKKSGNGELEHVENEPEGGHWEVTQVLRNLAQ